MPKLLLPKLLLPKAEDIGTYSICNEKNFFSRYAKKLVVQPQVGLEILKINDLVLSLTSAFYMAPWKVVDNQTSSRRAKHLPEKKKIKQERFIKVFGLIYIYKKKGQSY